MNKQNWIEDLKVGDAVIVNGGSWHTIIGELAEVEKVHKLHVVVKGKKYRKDNGMMAGKYQPYNHPRITKATKEDIWKIKKKKMEQEIEYFKDWSRMGYRALQTVLGMVRDVKRREKE